MARKSDIVDGLTSEVEGLSKRQAGEAFDGVFDAITAALAEGEQVQVAGFGRDATPGPGTRSRSPPATSSSSRLARL